MNIFTHIAEIDKRKMYTASNDIYCNEAHFNEVIYDDIELMDEVIEEQKPYDSKDHSALYNFYKGGIF